MSDMDFEKFIQKALEKSVTFDPVISVETIREFEEDNGIALPEELADFYTNAGNGCQMFLKGFPLNILNSLEDLEIDDEVNEEFPFTEFWEWEGGDISDEGSIEDISKGNIKLVDLGCGESWNIIVTGKERGKMWFFTGAGILPCAPGRGFFSWFDYCLDGDFDFFAENEKWDRDLYYSSHAAKKMAVSSQEPFGLSSVLCPSCQSFMYGLAGEEKRNIVAADPLFVRIFVNENLSKESAQVFSKQAKEDDRYMMVYYRNSVARFDPDGLVVIYKSDGSSTGVKI